MWNTRVCVCVCVLQVNLHAAALCNAAANGRRICIYIHFAQTRYDDNVGLAAAANSNCRVPMYYSIILYATAATAVENRQLVNNNNVIHRILPTLKLYIILYYNIYIYTFKIRTYCWDGKHPYVTTTNVVIISIIMSYALRRYVYNILQLWKPVVRCGRVQRRFRGGCRRRRQWWLLHNDLESWIVFNAYLYIYTRVQTNTYYIANLTITLILLCKRGHASVTHVPRIETAAADDDGLAEGRTYIPLRSAWLSRSTTI